MKLRAWILVLAIVVATPALQAQQDPFLGTWKQNLAKSKSDPGPAPKSPTIVKREAASGGAVKTTTDGVDAQGKPTHTEYTAGYDGKDTPLKGSPNYDTIALRKLDPNTRIAVYKKGGAVVRMSRAIVSKDGKTSTTEDIGAYGTGPAFHNVAVYDKQ